MKKIELRKVPCGETFIAFGEEFVVLDHVDGGVLSLRKSIWKKAQFDGNGNSNLAEASIRKVLGDYVDHLKCAGATDDAILPMCVDLKATDGTRVYGYCDCDAGLLTLEQYGKYKDIIPLADDWWWLATPVWTRWLRSPYAYNTYYVWGVYSDGDYSSNLAISSYGVRPALIFASCLLVSWHDEEGEDAPDEAVRKESQWDAYIAYLNDWADDHSDAESYGQTPASFDEWLENEYDPDEEQ